MTRLTLPGGNSLGPSGVRILSPRSSARRFLCLCVQPSIVIQALGEFAECLSSLSQVCVLLLQLIDRFFTLCERVLPPPAVLSFDHGGPPVQHAASLE